MSVGRGSYAMKKRIHGENSWRLACRRPECRGCPIPSAGPPVSISAWTSTSSRVVAHQRPGCRRCAHHRVRRAASAALWRAIVSSLMPCSRRIAARLHDQDRISAHARARHQHDERARPSSGRPPSGAMSPPSLWPIRPIFLAIDLLAGPSRNSIAAITSAGEVLAGGAGDLPGRAADATVVHAQHRDPLAGEVVGEHPGTAGG